MKNADTLHQAIAAARDGRRDEARVLLMRTLEADPRNERAWLWLSGVVDDPNDVKICLENVLALNPSNPRARQGLEWLHAHIGLPLPSLPSPAQLGSGIEREIDASALSLTRLRAYQATLADVATAPAPEAAIRSSPMPAPAPARQSAQTLAPGSAPVRQSVQAAPAPAPARQSVQAAPAPASARAAIQSGSPAASRTPTAASSRLASIATDDNTIPCPYCGAPTVEAQRRCTQCNGSLLVRAALSDERSPIVQTLVWLWRGGAIATVLIALIFPVLGVFLYQENQAYGFPIGILIPAVILALVGMVGFSVAQQLAQRSVWALYLAAGLTIIGLIGALALVARPDTITNTLDQLTGATPLPSDWLAPLQSGARLIGIGAIVTHITAIALTAVGHNDIVGKLERFRHVLKPSDHVTHYNNGVALKNRGMWYAASLEWEWAVKKAPYDATYLRALGLAYARLKQFDKARAMLDRALQASPNQPGLAEDRALIERLASQNEH
ncbi:MAG: tetratricopeptide repeat protein [Roseiflexus sp.]|nr:tetratricopeptide repeat protein [Roseiflexus sp.]MCS7289287.1 tetratricopeptide repeat protein [Roseiflexus sp.]MDW8145010.1 tetratricopeptide repeat protein [Roseiflexaceae bacterium]MDW8231882.1 tetratricopeptide repeat protein [Roseiflexaceae bacterium]